MNRMFLLAGLLVLGMAPAAEAVTVIKGVSKPKPPDKNCVPDQRCPKGVSPPKCCRPPPCEFLEALRNARAKKELYWEKFASRGGEQESSSEDELVPLTPEGQDELVPLAPVKFDSADYERFKQEASEAMNKAIQKFPKCPKRRYPDPPIFSVMPSRDCVTERYDKAQRSFAEVTLDQAKAESGACSEIVEAKYAAATAREHTCAVEVMDAENYTERAHSVGEELDAEYQSLMDAFQNYLYRCSVTPDSKIARQAAAAGIKELKFNPPPEPPKKKGPRGKTKKKGR